MKQRFGATTAVVILVCVLAASAGDPWLDKPYTEWDQREVNRILRDSPWAQTVIVTWGGSIISLGAGSASRPHSVFVVQWASALTVRQAIARQAQLAQAAPGNPSPAGTIAEPTSQPPENFALLVWWIREASQSQPASAKISWSDVAYLKSDKAKKPVAASKVQPLGDGIVQLEFPRLVDGKEWLPADGKTAHLEYRAFFLLPGAIRAGTDMPIAVTFDLRKMVRNGKPDL